MPDLAIVQIPTLYLVGIHGTTSLAEQGVPALWQQFRPQVSKVVVKTAGFFNVTIYPEALNFKDFGPNTKYEAWVAVATAEDLKIPEGMAMLEIETSTYAKVEYQGLAQHFGPFVANLYGNRIPAAGYAIDNSRPHFEYLPEDYRPDNPEGREEVYVPVIKLP